MAPDDGLGSTRFSHTFRHRGHPAGAAEVPAADGSLKDHGVMDGREPASPFLDDAIDPLVDSHPSTALLVDVATEGEGLVHPPRIQRLEDLSLLFTSIHSPGWSPRAVSCRASAVARRQMTERTSREIPRPPGRTNMASNSDRVNVRTCRSRRHCPGFQNESPGAVARGRVVAWQK